MTAGGESPQPEVTRHFRADIEGLRALAVIAVIAFHARLGGAHGGFVGVDVFFVISGFLITRQLLSEASRTNSISFLHFYGRRAKRLLPAAATTLLGCVLLTWWFIPRTRWETWGGDIGVAAAYLVNWRFAGQATDYFANDPNTSIVQHFWSLAVEEQFYVVWPIVLFGARAVIKRRGISPPRAYAVALTAMVLPSLLYSAWRTGRDPGPAYFVSTTRVWELGIGGLVAVAGPLLARLRPRVGRASAWLGVTMIGSSLVAFSPATPWPGVAALLPTAGTALTIGGGFTAGPGGPVRLLGGRLGRQIGAMSYSLYLWHWTALGAALTLRPHLSMGGRLLAALASAAPAYLTFRFVENPVRRSAVLGRRPALALALGVALSIVALGAGWSLGDAVSEAPAVAANLGTVAPARSPAQGSLPNVVDTIASQTAPSAPGPLTPAPERALADKAVTDRTRCIIGFSLSTVRTCELGDPTASKVLALVGDSKASQWAFAVDAAAKRLGYRVVTYLKSACSWNDEPQRGPNDRVFAECQAWVRNVTKALGERRPDVVVVSSVKASLNDSSPERPTAMIAGYVARWSELTGRGTPVVVVADVPSPPFEVPECVVRHLQNLDACSWPANDGNGTPALLAAAQRVRGAASMTMNDVTCPGRQVCRAVLGNVITYRAGSHLTNTMVKAITPTFVERLRETIENARQELVAA